MEVRLPERDASTNRRQLQKAFTLKAFTVEAWLKSLALRSSDEGKVAQHPKRTVSTRNALRMGRPNPIREVRQSSKRVREPDVLTPPKCLH